MSDVDIHHLAAAYALDAVDEDERRAFEAHFHDCDVCRADVVDHRETLARLAAATPATPSAEVKQQVMDEIARTRQLSPLLPAGVTSLTERRRRRLRTAAGGLLAAAAAVGLFLAGGVLVGRDDVPAYRDEVAAVLEQPDGRVLDLAPGEDATGTVRVAWSASTGRAVVLADGLSPAPAGSAYELWLIDDDGPRPMRLLAPASNGEVRAVVDVASGAGEPSAWGVTIEPASGSPAPTGEILFLAEA